MPGRLRDREAEGSAFSSSLWVPIVGYPEAARKAGIQGTIVLKVATAYSGDVKEVTVVSGGYRPGANSGRRRHGPSAVGAGTGM
jgi:hypothetical protein